MPLSGNYRINRYLFGRLPVGHVFIVLAYFAALTVFCLFAFDLSDVWEWEDVGYRTGFISMAQLPLIFLLASKNNVIGFLTGTSYERLNWMHRWAARALLFTSTLHMGYWFRDWARYDYISEKVKTDPITQKGIAAWSILLWIVISSVMPIRSWSYEIFVLQHLISFAAFIGVVYIHTPAEVHVWIWIPVGLFFLDRVVRAAFVIYTNLSIFHPRLRKQRDSETKNASLWTCRATFTPLPCDVTRITIPNPPISWSPGQHIFLSCHSLVPLQSHPFTINSLPSDNKLEILARSERGGTRSFFRHATKSHSLPSTTINLRFHPSTTAVGIEGPYGRMRPLKQFDTVTLVAGGIGATFTVPLLRDIILGWRERIAQGVVTRRIRFVWAVKSCEQLRWFESALDKAMTDVLELRRETGTPLELDVLVCVSCDDSVTSVNRLFAHASGVQETKHGKVEKTELEEQALAHTGLPETQNEKPKEKDTRTVQTLRPTSLHSISSTSSSTPLDSSDKICASCGCMTMVPILADAKHNVPSTCTCSSAKPSVPLAVGRPNLYKIIQAELEVARGESAVVVCGPRAMAQDVRSAVVRLSDERGIHKGTGAQGVWLWVEGFAY
ncbi:MAG: hypothetical protein M1824_000856 [Vezdaea acicularis]|nr:MAG: hypothetical protein M1824_000856 [Vezdaea acicularis]